jgi:hypothetical protein
MSLGKLSPKLISSDIRDEHIPSLEFTRVMIQVRKCQLNNTLTDNLLIKLRELAGNLDGDLLKRCTFYADYITGF